MPSRAVPRGTPPAGPDVDRRPYGLRAPRGGRGERRRSSASGQPEQPRSEPLFDRGGGRVTDGEPHADLSIDFVDVRHLDPGGAVAIDAESLLERSHDSA